MHITMRENKSKTSQNPPHNWFTLKKNADVANNFTIQVRNRFDALEKENKEISPNITLNNFMMSCEEALNKARKSKNNNPKPYSEPPYLNWVINFTCKHSNKMATWKGRETGRSSYQKLPNDESMLQQENDMMVSNLASKISNLKNIALDIDNEAKYQNKFVGGMSGDFDSASGFLSTSMGRLSTVITSSSSNRKLMCYLILFLVGAFFVGYYLIGHFRT